MPGSYARIYEVVRAIPRGKVATYGQVAKLAGLGPHARQVGYALSALDDDTVPWQRVINSKGEISVRSGSLGHMRQRSLLEAEGVRFDGGGRITLEKFRWRPNRKQRRRGRTRTRA